MPLFLHEPLNESGEWGLWKIEETEDWLLAASPLHPQELIQFSAIKGRGRRCEYLAARLLLHTMSGRAERGELVKDANGKPHLSDSHFHVSISHTHGYSGAIAHPRPCGIDVQRIVPKIRRIARKFVNVVESQYLTEDNELLLLHVVWSAKEAMYKAYGRRQIDFRNDLHVELSDFDAAVPYLPATLRREEVEMNFLLQFRVYDGFVLVAAVEE